MTAMTIDYLTCPIEKVPVFTNIQPLEYFRTVASQVWSSAGFLDTLLVKAFYDPTRAEQQLAPEPVEAVKDWSGHWDALYQPKAATRWDRIRRSVKRWALKKIGHYDLEVEQDL